VILAGSPLSSTNIEFIKRTNRNVSTDGIALSRCCLDESRATSAPEGFAELRPVDRQAGSNLKGRVADDLSRIPKSVLHLVERFIP
jgi:hypothetical protein